MTWWKDRTTALGLLCISLSFSGLVAGTLLASHSLTTETILDHPLLSSLERALAERPEDVNLKRAYREADSLVRESYFRQERRSRWGFFLLLGGVAVTVIAARWYVKAGGEQPCPADLAERRDEERWERRQRLKLAATGATVAAMVAAVWALSFVGGLRFPMALKTLRPGPQAPLPEVAPAWTPPGPALKAEPTQEESSLLDCPWPRFRGPSGLGIVTEGTWPRDWNLETGEGIVWRVSLDLPGKSSPVLCGNKVFLTAGNEKTCQVLCFDAGTGERLWHTPIQTLRPWMSDDWEVFEETGYAASSPATDGRRVFALFANADLAGVDFDGRPVWTRNMGDPDSAYGLSSSLVVWEDKLLLQLDRGSMAEDNLSAVYAIDTRTGETVWKTPRPVPASWSSPIVVETEAGWEFITCANPFVISYDPATGEERWRAEVLFGDVAPGPVYADGLVFVTNENAFLTAIRVGGEGDVTETHVVWRSEVGLSDASTPVAAKNLVLQAHSYGILTCFDAKKGDLLWEHQTEAGFWASPVLVRDTIYLAGDDGTMLLFPLSPEGFALEKVLDLGEPVSATPAFVNGSIYVRTESQLARIGE